MYLFYYLVCSVMATISNTLKLDLTPVGLHIASCGEMIVLVHVTNYLLAFFYNII